MTWPAALIAGALYLIIGRAFPAPEPHVQAWRLAAWLASGVVFAAHLSYEHFRLRHTPGATARHAALGVAIGAFALAAYGMIRELAGPAAFRPRWLLALAAWPLLTALPAFIVGMVVARLFTRIQGHPRQTQ